MTLNARRLATRLAIARDGHCADCGATSQLRAVTAQPGAGRDRPDNLVVVCADCRDKRRPPAEA